MTKEETKTGKELELGVAQAYRDMGARKVEHDVELAGNQVDVYVELETADRGLLRIAVEAKDYSSPVGIDVVNGFAQRVNLLRSQGLIDRGVIVSAAGFSRPGRNAAKQYGIRLLTPEDLDAMVRETEKEERWAPPPYSPPTPPGPETVPEPGPLPPGHRIPFARNGLFTGRKRALKALAGALLYEEAPSALVTQAVAGMGGVGKTQLAVEFAYRYGRFFHGVHWLNAREPAALGAEVAACGAAMAASGGLPGWPDKLPEQVSRTLEAWRRGGRRLVVLDNLEEVAAAREWLGRLSGGGVRVLVTARRTDWPRDLGLRPLRLEVFAPEESRAFLREYLGEERATGEELDRLAERLGHLPLALELAGRYLEDYPTFSVGAYLEEFEEVLAHPSMGGWDTEAGSPTDHDLNVMATFELSWRRVKDEGACRVFQLAGYCAPNEPIPDEVLRQASDLDDREYGRAVHVLVGLGLLGGSEAGPVVHPLLGEYGRGLPDAPEALPALADALVSEAKAANDRMDQTGSPSAFAPVLPHVRVVAGAAEDGAAADAAVLLVNLGYYLKRMADYDGARAALERALAIHEQIYGPEHLEVATDVNNLGNVLKDLGNLVRARAALERALAIDERVLGPEHPSVARDVNNLGLVLKDLGDLAGARAASERALAIDERVFGPEHPSVAIYVNNLGSVLQDLGDLAGARAAYERVYGLEHPEVATDVNNLGLVLKDLGDLAGARAAYERALAIDERVFGPEHPNAAIHVNNLGLVLKDLGDLAGARAAFERALEIWRAVYGDEHPQVATAHNNLGSVLQDLGDLAGARAAFERALRIWRAAYGDEHPQVATAHNNLGSVLKDLGDPAGARVAFERALAIDERVFGPEHPDVARDVNNLGSVLKDQGDLAGARAAFERALGIWEKCLPAGHRSIEIARGHLESLGSTE